MSEKIPIYISDDKLKEMTNDKNQIDFYELNETIYNILNNYETVNDTGKILYTNLINQYKYFKNEFETEQELLNQKDNIIQTLKIEKDTEQENLNNQLNNIMKKNYNLTEKNNDLFVKLLSSETNNKQIKDNYERKIKFLSDELEKSQTENKKLNSELNTLKTITSSKSSSSEYMNVDNYNSPTKETKNNVDNQENKNNDTILLNTENIALFDNNTNIKSKTQKKNIEYFQEEMNKYNDKEYRNKEVFIKNQPTISYSTDYLPELLKNTDKINNHITTEINNKYKSINELTKFKNNPNLEIIEEDDENEEIEEKTKIENKLILGGYIPNTKGKPKNHIYDINGNKKMLIGDDFTTLTDQGDYDYKKRHLTFKRKNTRYNKNKK